MRKIILAFFILSPLVDYTYRLKFASIGEIELSPNRIFKFIPILLFVFYHLSTNKGFFWKKSTNLLIYLLLPFSIGLLYFPSETIDAFFRFLSSFIFLFFAGRLLNEEDFFKILRAWALISVIPIALSYLQFFGYIPYTDFDTIAGMQIGRVSGYYEKQVAMMWYLIYTFPYALYIFIKRKIIFKILLTPYIAALLGVVILSTHRASMVIFLIIIFYLLFIYSKKYLIVFSIILLSIIIVQWEYIVTLYNLTASVEKFFRGRPILWIDYISNLFNSGFFFVLFGKGNAVLVTYKYQVHPFGHNEPHSDYVRILYQYGIIGLFLYLAIMFTIIRQNIIINKKTTLKNIKFLTAFEVIIGISILLYSITLEPTRYPSFLWLYTAIASFLLVNKKKLIQKYENHPNN